MCLCSHCGSKCILCAPCLNPPPHMCTDLIILQHIVLLNLCCCHVRYCDVKILEGIWIYVCFNIGICLLRYGASRTGSVSWSVWLSCSWRRITLCWLLGTCAHWSWTCWSGTQRGWKPAGGSTMTSTSACVWPSANCSASVLMHRRKWDPVNLHPESGTCPFPSTQPVKMLMVM